MSWPPPKSTPRPQLQYSRDGQMWRTLSGDDVDQLFGFLMANPFTRRRVLSWGEQLQAGNTVRVFAGRDFEVFLRHRSAA